MAATGLPARIPRWSVAQPPPSVRLVGYGAAAMLVPCVFALWHGDRGAAQSFGFSAVLFGGLFALLAVALSGRTDRHAARSHLVALAVAFTALPAMLAVPFHQAADGVGFFAAWFEMISSITTTGATLFERAGDLTPTLHLWRVLVGWLGGLLMWIAAIAVLAPLNLGGFEVTGGDRVAGGPGSGANAGNAVSRDVDARIDAAEAAPRSQIREVADPTERLARFASRLAPIYAGLTLALTMLLIGAGASPFVAICTAMSTMATSGILPADAGYGGSAGVGVEVAVCAFLIFAVSRRTYGSGRQDAERSPLWRDPEIAIAATCVVVLPAMLFLRHWTGAYESSEEADLDAALRALWGAVFNTLSFLTTTGFVSTSWESARSWSGLETPGMILLGLSLVGGGVATSAGGVKLLRIYALYKHGLREMEKLVHPSSVGGSGRTARHIRRRGAYVAWIFFMLFALSVALVMSALSLTGIPFDASVVLTVAALSTTGPLAAVGGEVPILYSALGPAAQVILAMAMVLGRLETLALIALLNPNVWRR